MPQAPIQFPLRSRWLLCIEILTLCSILAIVLVLLDAPLTGGLVFVLGIAACIFFWIWTGRTLLLTPGAFTFLGGALLPTQRVLRRRTVTQILCFCTPLLWLADCRILVFFTVGGRVYLPGLSRTDADRVLDWYRA